MAFRPADEENLPALLRIARQALLWYVIGLALVGLVFVLPASGYTLFMFLTGELLVFVGNVWLIVALTVLLFSALTAKWKVPVAALLLVAIVALPIEYHLFTTP